MFQECARDCACVHRHTRMACRHAHAEAGLFMLLSLSTSPLSSFLNLSNNRIKGMHTVPASSVWTCNSYLFSFLCIQEFTFHYFFALFSEATLKSICRFTPFGLGFLFICFVCSFDTGSSLCHPGWSWAYRDLVWDMGNTTLRH